MGRGRKGPVEQSIKKPKGLKCQKNGEDLHVFWPHVKQENYSVLLSEDLLAEMKKMSPQKLMNILSPNK